MDFETVIGLEVHAQLKTRTKMFCADAAHFGATPNTQVCPVCLGLPGALPTINRKAIEYAVRAALALNCEIHPHSVFARKNYFYPDLTKGYQISQFDQPLAERGRVEIDLGEGRTRTIRITRIHVEEDAGKNQHVEGREVSWVDFNRCGVPLIEIVSEPDLRSAEEAGAYLKKLRQILRYLDVCDGNMEEGSLRCDVNVSLRPVGRADYGTRSEVKNVSSFRFVMKAIAVETERHREILESGGKVVQETRLFDPASGKTFSLRGKEEAHDYRYFPEPDLVPLDLPEGWVAAIAGSQRELPDGRKARYRRDFGLSAYDAAALTAEEETGAWFEQCVKAGADPKKAANWIMGEIAQAMNERSIPLSDLPISPERMAGLIRLVEEGRISGRIAKSLFAVMLTDPREPDLIVASTPEFQLIEDAGAIERAVEEVLLKNPEIVERFRGGNERVLGALVGQVMKATQGKADPPAVSRLLLERLKPA